MKYKPNYKPPGNLMFARNLLTFSKNEDKCRMGEFNNVLSFHSFFLMKFTIIECCCF